MTRSAPATGPVEDLLAIRALVEAYADAVFRHDGDQWINTWAPGPEPEPTWNLLGNALTGRETILGAWKHAMGDFSLTGFFCTPGMIYAEGDKGESRIWVQEILKPKNGGDVRRIIGRYDDSYVKIDGRWYIARRDYQILDTL